MPRGRLALLLAVGAAVGGSTAATLAAGHDRRAPTRSRYSVSIQAVFDQRGDPVLVANFTPDGGFATPHWTVCHPAGCAPGRPPLGEPANVLEPGPEPAGTVFRAGATFRGHDYVASVRWHGRVRIVAPPWLRGRPWVGARVVPMAGRWVGGWGTEFDQRGVEACRTVHAHGCVLLSGGEPGCPEPPAAFRVRARFLGWFLFAIDTRSARNEACAGVGLPWPEPAPKLTAMTRRSRPIGPVSRGPAPVVRTP